MTAPGSDPHDLARFITAQEAMIDRVRAELRAGRKASHWMWFVFPQIVGLGRSETARFYAIRTQEEAAAYLAHPVLGSRLVECTRLVNAVEGSTAEQIFGQVDAMKFHSCMTLFAHVCSPAQGHGMNSGLQDAINLAWKLALVCHGYCNPVLLDSYEAERRPVAEMITASGDAVELAQMIADPAERLPPQTCDIMRRLQRRNSIFTMATHQLLWAPGTTS